MEAIDVLMWLCTFLMFYRRIIRTNDMGRLSLGSDMLKMLCSMCDYYPVKSWEKDLAWLSSQIHPESRQSSSSVCGHETSEHSSLDGCSWDFGLSLGLRLGWAFCVHSGAGGVKQTCRTSCSFYVRRGIWAKNRESCGGWWSCGIISR